MTDSIQREEWDFRHLTAPSVDDSEILACMLYEYAREHPLVLEAKVEHHRISANDRSALSAWGDKYMALSLIDLPFPFIALPLTLSPDLYDKPWQNLGAKLRKRLTNLMIAPRPCVLGNGRDLRRLIESKAAWKLHYPGHPKANRAMGPDYALNPCAYEGGVATLILKIDFTDSKERIMNGLKYLVDKQIKDLDKEDVQGRQWAAKALQSLDSLGAMRMAYSKNQNAAISKEDWDEFCKCFSYSDLRHRVRPAREKFKELFRTQRCLLQNRGSLIIQTLGFFNGHGPGGNHDNRQVFASRMANAFQNFKTTHAGHDQIQ